MTHLAPDQVERLAFDLEYDGEALAAHEMDVRNLAPALLSAAALFRELNRLAHPGDPDVQVNIKATSEGSFLIQLALLYDHTVRVLASPQVEAQETAVMTLTGLLTLLVTMIGLRKKRDRDGAPHQVDDVSPGEVRITWPDGTTLEVPAEAWRLLDDPRVARPLADMVRPVGEPGIDTMRIKREGQVAAEVTTGDLPAFSEWSDSPREILIDTEREVFLTIRGAFFDPRLKWRFNDGLNNFAAHITDPDFQARVEAGEPFAKGDTLRCVLRTTQWRDTEGQLHTDVEVTRVLEHSFVVPPPRLFEPPSS